MQGGAAHAGIDAAGASGVASIADRAASSGGGGIAGNSMRAGQGGSAGSSNAGTQDMGASGSSAGPTDDAGRSMPITDGGQSAGTGLIWPNDESNANSDPWLVEHHDEIGQLQPRVLVIDLESTDDAPALVDKHIKALEEASSFHKYKDASAQPALAFKLLKIVQASKGARIDYESWNTQQFADDNLQIKDPEDPSGPNLTLCGMFERGLINEVWCMASSSPKCGETQEAKQSTTKTAASS